MKKNFTTYNNIHLYRYIDDIIFLANHTKGLFSVKCPSYLNLIKNILTNNSINFFGLKIILNNQQLCIIYDKRKGFDFEVSVFTNFNSRVHLSVYRIKSHFKSYFLYKKLMFSKI